METINTIVENLPAIFGTFAVVSFALSALLIGSIVQFCKTGSASWLWTAVSTIMTMAALTITVAQFLRAVRLGIAYGLRNMVPFRLLGR